MADKTESDNETQMGIYYQRSRHYRTVHADGAQFGITPRGMIQFTLFTDQKPMPEFVLHKITPEGNLGAIVEEVVKDGAIREVEINVVMDTAVAISFANIFLGLLKQVKALEEQASKIAKPQVSASSADSEQHNGN